MLMLMLCLHKQIQCFDFDYYWFWPKKTLKIDRAFALTLWQTQESNAMWIGRLKRKHGNPINFFSQWSYHSGNHPLGNSDQRFLVFNFKGENWTFLEDSIVVIFTLSIELYSKGQIMTFFFTNNHTFTMKICKESTFLHTYET